MRVTQNMMTDSLMRYLTSQNEALFERQTIIASHKRINKPSDDPIGMGKVLDYRQTLASIEQYQINIHNGITRLGFIDSSLELVDDLLESVSGTAYIEGSGTTESRQLAAGQVKNLYDQIMDMANSKLNDNYIFSGYQTKTAPFSRDEAAATTYDQFTITYNGDAGEAQFMVANNTEVTIDADGRPLFHDAASGGINVFDVLRDLIVGLENDDTAAITAQQDLLDQAQVQMNTIRAANSPILYQFETTENHWHAYKPNIEKLLSKEEEADITRAVVELQSIELAYQSTMATAAKVIQPGLVQFLQ